jgi:PadR family transcriptional regulator, regulatory protein PadR
VQAGERRLAVRPLSLESGETIMKFRKELVGGTTATLILSVLKAGDAHGYEIVRKVNALSDGALEWQEGTIYPALHRLEKSGLIAGRWKKASNGKKRRVYGITDDGRGTLEAQKEEWEAYTKAVGSVLEVSHA